MNSSKMQAIRDKVLDPASSPVPEDGRGQWNMPSKSDLNEWVKLIGGSALVGFGLSRRSLPGLAIAGVGGYLAWNSLQVLCGPCLEGDPDEAPREGVVQNSLDEASWESFPASDPPAYNTSTA